jgi:PKD repeat protein
VLALAAACTDDITTAPEITPTRPRLDVAAAAAPISFCNPATVTIRDANSAVPYPSTLTVSGASAGPFKITVTLREMNHPTPLDLEALVAGPGGQAILLMSDVGGSGDLRNTTLTFDDDASAHVPATGSTALSGSYKPTNLGTPDALPGPAPREPYVTSLAAFAGTDPNGTWRLFLIDDTILGGGGGSVAGGWCVNIVPMNAAPVANAGGPYAGAEGSPITFDGTSSTDPDNNIESYAWDFGDGETGNGPAPEHTYANSGTYTVTLVLTDDDGATSEATGTVTVDNVAPTATFSAPVSVNEGSAISLALTDAADPSPADQTAGFTYAFDCGAGYGEFGAASAASCPTTDDETRQVRAKVRDKDLGESEYAAFVTVANVAPTVTALTLPADPVAVGAPLTIGASFTDAGTADLHTATFDLDDGRTTTGTVVESNGSGSASASVSYAAAGVYTIGATATDDDGGSGSRSSAADVPAYVVVYDPTGGFVTGGGWISSPAGAYAAEPTFTGKATFGFVAKYLKGANKPSGNTEFQFKAGGLNFKSTSYEWLVVANAHAKYKGEGTINGAGSYGFMITAVDGELPGGSGTDGFRMKIWELASGAIVYDNKMGEGNDSEAATQLGGGSIVIHK